MKNLHWIDTAKIGLPANLHKDAQGFVDDVMKGAGADSFLEAKFRATHSGHLIPHRCYTGAGMKAGCPTWYSVDRGGASRYDKPVLLNHDAVGPTVGRIVMAEYVQLKTGKEFTDDWKEPDSGLKMGSGYIVTTANILDPDAVTKLLDGRYHTVSTRQDPRDAWCSTCGKSFRDGCDHELGEYYEDDKGDKYLCYAVTGFLDYVEMSIVALPNQPNAVKISSKQIQKQLQDAGKVEDILLVSSFADSEIPVLSLKMGSKKTGGSADLTGPALPSLADMTGKVQVTMSGKNAAPPDVKIEGLEKAVADAAAAKVEAPKAEEKVADGATTNSVKAEEPKVADAAAGSAPTQPKSKVFGTLVRIWKDDLDLKTSFADSSYLCGITDAADGHAHVFDGFLDLKKSLFSGYTTTIGQGKPDEYHGHSIWVEGVDIKTNEVDGETRSASRGPDHTHDFSTYLIDAARGFVSIMDGNVVGEALSDQVEFDKTIVDSKIIPWDAEYVACAMNLLPRMKDTKRHEILADLELKGFLKKTEKKISDEKTTSAEMDSLKATKADLEKKLADVVSLHDAAEKRAQSLLAENTALRVAALRDRAGTVVRLRARIANQVLEDSTISTQIDELLKTEDENKINESLKACTMSVVAGKSQVSDAGPAKLVADAAAKVVVPVVEQKPSKDTKKKSHDNDLDRLADDEFGTDD